MIEIKDLYFTNDFIKELGPLVEKKMFLLNKGFYKNEKIKNKVINSLKEVISDIEKDKCSDITLEKLSEICNITMILMAENSLLRGKDLIGLYK